MEKFSALNLLNLSQTQILKEHTSCFTLQEFHLLSLEEILSLKMLMPNFRKDQFKQREWLNALDDAIIDMETNGTKSFPKFRKKHQQDHVILYIYATFMGDGYWSFTPELCNYLDLNFNECCKFIKFITGDQNTVFNLKIFATLLIIMFMKGFTSPEWVRYKNKADKILNSAIPFKILIEKKISYSTSKAFQCSSLKNFYKQHS